MVAAALKASFAGAWAGSFAPPSYSSRCSSWVSGLTPEPVRRRVEKVAVRFAQKRSQPFCVSGLNGSFGGERLVSKGCVRSFQRTRVRRVSASQDEPSERKPDLDSIPLEPTTFEEETFQHVKAAYVKPHDADTFKGAEELLAEYDRQRCMKNLVHEPLQLERAENRFRVQGVEADDGSLSIFDWKQAASMIGVVALPFFMFLAGPAPPKGPAMRETKAYRQSVSTAASRRGRRAAARNAQADQVAPSGALAKAVLASVAIVMVIQALKKNPASQTPLLVDIKPEAPEEKPGLTVFHLHVGISGTATSLRYDLSDIGDKPDDVYGWSRQPETLRDMARVLMKNLEFISYADNQVHHSENPSAAYTFVKNWELADESQVRHAETADRLRDIYVSYGHTLKEKNTLLLDSAKAGFTVVTLTGAVKGRVSMPKVEDSLTLHFMLANLEVLDPADVELVRVSWTPTEGESLPEETMHKFFPHMGLIVDRKALERARAEEFATDA